MGEAAMLFLQVLFLMWRLDGEVRGGVSIAFAAAVFVRCCRFSRYHVRMTGLKSKQHC